MRYVALQKNPGPSGEVQVLTLERCLPFLGFLSCSGSDQFMSTGPWNSPSLRAFLVNEAFFDEGHQISGGSPVSYRSLV